MKMVPRTGAPPCGLRGALLAELIPDEYVYKPSAKISVNFGGDSRLVNVGFSTKIQDSSGKSASPIVFPNCLKASVEGFTLSISDRNESGRGQSQDREEGPSP